MLCFALIMFFLAVTAHFRGPVFSHASAFWFFTSWLPGELPWLFGAIQIVCVFIFVLLSETFSVAELGSLFIAAVTCVIWFHLHLKTRLIGPVLQSALRNTLGENFESMLPTNVGIASPSVSYERNWLNPFGYSRQGIERLKNIHYGDAERNLLDICRSLEPSHHKSARPVLLHVHGGGWVIGNKRQQAQPLINYLAQHGWICVDINYRLAPRNRYPDCLVDVKKAIVWIKENIANYGGNPNFIALTGGSAGGHLVRRRSRGRRHR